jgi:hypothetical protein
MTKLTSGHPSGYLLPHVRTTEHVIQATYYYDYYYHQVPCTARELGKYTTVCPVLTTQHDFRPATNPHTFNDVLARYVSLVQETCHCSQLVV